MYIATDHLTGGLTEYMFEYLFQERLKRIEGSCGLICMNVKRFSAINMLYGSETGDSVLKEIYHILKGKLQPDELISRVYSDCFFVLVGAQDKDALEARICELDDAVYYHTGFDIFDHIFFSIGAYLIPDTGTSYRQAADFANYSRAACPDLSDENTCYEIYGYTIQDTRVCSAKMLKRGHAALENGHFEIYLQPKYELVQETIAGAEALIRWNDPEEGLIPLPQFMPAFEESGFIRQIDYFVFEAVLQLLERRLENGQPVVPISLNLSKAHFTNQMFFEDRLLPIFQKYHVPAELIEFELSESLIMSDEKPIRKLLELSQAQGFSCSLDDFGSGYSCLNTLKTLPITTLKLDQKMFTEEDKERGKIIIAGTLAVARQLGIQVVSEGVETREYVDFLKAHDGGLVQGYYFSRPVPVQAFEALLDK